MAPAIVNTTIQATFLAVLSNLLAQGLTAYQSSKSFRLDVGPIINFIIFTIISTPPNVLWQDFLESQFPSYPAAPKAKNPPKEKMNVLNTAIKFCLDQTVGALVNTVLFIGAMAALRGMSNKDIYDSIQKDTWPIMLAGYKLWPLVSIISFTMVPVQQRVVFASVVGVGWGVFLSLLANK